MLLATTPHLRLSAPVASLSLNLLLIKILHLPNYSCVDLSTKLFVMRKYFLLLLSIGCLLTTVDAQLTALPNGGNKKAMVGERIGITDVVISYSRPGVKG